MDHCEDQQVSGQLTPLQHSEPLQQPPHQNTQLQTYPAAASEVVAAALLTDIPQHNKEWVEIDQLTSMAAQWSNHPHSTPV